MNTTTRMALTAAAVFLAGAAHAYGKDDTVGVGIGVAGDSCGKWISGRTARPAETLAIMEPTVMSWVQGYMTASNILGEPRNIIALPAASVISLWLDKACRDDPVTPVYVHLDRLMVDLRRRAGKN